MAKKKATKKKAKAPEFTYDDVDALADDINDKALFDDIIEFEEDASVEDVVEAVKDVIMDGDECQIFNTDGLYAESFKTLELIGCPAVSEGEEEVEEEPEEEPEEKPKKKPAKKATKKAAKKADKKPAAEKPKKEPAIKVSSRSRAQCIADAMKKIGTYDVDEISLEANKLFIENGGKDSMAQSTYFTRKLVAFAKEFKLAD